MYEVGAVEEKELDNGGGVAIRRGVSTFAFREVGVSVTSENGPIEVQDGQIDVFVVFSKIGALFESADDTVGNAVGNADRAQS